MDYGNGRIFFHTKEYEKTIFFGFFLLKEKNRYEFLTKDEENFTKVRKFLQSKLILMTFHVDYQVVKMIGKGSFAKVFH